MANSGPSFPSREDPRGSSEAAWNAFRGLIAVAIRDYPAHAGRPGWSYGLDDLDFEDFVPDLADYIMAVVTGSAR
jgi:hypothetical protein